MRKPNRPPGWLEPIVRSGEYTLLASQCRTDRELADRLGVSTDSLFGARKILRQRGLSVPGRHELSRSAPHEAPEDDFVDEDPTNPGATFYAPANDEAVAPQPAIPPGHFIKGLSTLVGPDGGTLAQWIKTSREHDPITDVFEAFRAIKDELPQAEGPQPAPPKTDPRLLSTYLLGDCHVGMHAWRGDAGANFDLKIAERNLTGLTSELVNL